MRSLKLLTTFFPPTLLPSTRSLSTSLSSHASCALLPCVKSVSGESFMDAVTTVSVVAEV